MIYDLNDAPVRFAEKVTISEDGCWIWLASLTRLGYARFRVGDKIQRASRVAYEQFIGLIPEGLELDHLCGNRACVNPAHLEAVTHAENVRRGEAAGRKLARTHCKRGHEYTTENTGRDSDGWRVCRACARENTRLYRARAA